MSRLKGPGTIITDQGTGKVNIVIAILCYPVSKKEEKAMAEILTYAEAEEIYHVMEEGIDRRDEDIAGMYKDMIARAVKYANIRAGWNLTENGSEILPALLLCLRGYRHDSLVFGAPSGAPFLYII